jgi:YggT family protein
MFLAPARLPGHRAFPAIAPSWAPQAAPLLEETDGRVPVFVQAEGLPPVVQRAPAPEMFGRAAAVMVKPTWKILLATYLGGMTGFLKVYMVLLTLRIYMTWFVNLNSYRQPFLTLARMTDPYMRVFRGLLPPLLGLDLSPILGFFLITWAQQSLEQVAFLYG